MTTITTSMTLSIAGSGMIVEEVLRMLRNELPDIQPRSIFAHSNVERARQLAADYDIPQVFTDYDLMLRDDKSDFVYVANVNTAHYHYALKALEAGRNVIVEKPLCMTLAEAETLVDTARQRNLMLIEAVSLLHMPNFRALKLSLPLLGSIRLVECDYSQRSSRLDRYLQGDVAPAFDPACGGGALRDLNVYNINFVVALFGEPLSAEYHSNSGSNGVDTSGILVMHYPDFQCVCSAGKDCYGAPYALIQGDSGIVRVEGPVSVLGNCSFGTRTAESSRQLHWQSIDDNRFAHRLAHEFDTFRTLFVANDHKAFHQYQDISLAVMRIIDSVRFDGQ